MIAVRRDRKCRRGINGANGPNLYESLSYTWNTRRKKGTWHIMEVNRSIAEQEPGRHPRIIPMSVQDAPTKTRKRTHALDTRLHGRWLLLARGLWITLVVITLTIFFASLPVYIAQLH